MSIRLRILTLLSLLSVVCMGIFFQFQHAQVAEETFARRQRERELTKNLQQLVNSASRSAYHYLRNYAGRSGMVDFLSTEDAAWAEKYLKGRMDLYRVDAVWVLRADGTVVYGHVRPTGATLTPPPLPGPDTGALLKNPGNFSFHTFLGDRLYQYQGMPLVTTPGLDRKATTLGWLIVAKHWDQTLLDEMSDNSRGRITLTSANRPSHLNPEPGLETWQPLLNQRGQAIAGLDYHAPDYQAESPAEEHFELMLFVLNSVGLILFAGVLLHFLLLRPLFAVRESLLAGDPAPLAPLLHQRNEFGQIARALQQSMHDRRQHDQDLEERVRLARELHDGAIQGVYGAGMALGQAQSLLAQDLPAARRLLEETRDELNRIIHDLRGHIERVDPKPVGTTFNEAVARLIQQLHGPGPITSEINIDDGLVAAYVPLFQSEALRFVREALSNAMRHGYPSRLAVSWQRTPEGSTLTVGDDGQGFVPAEVKTGGRGLGNLSERALSLGGHLEIDSHPGQGTRISLKLPPAKTRA